jgi:hypothetical protein
MLNRLKEEARLHKTLLLFRNKFTEAPLRAPSAPDVHTHADTGSHTHSRKNTVISRQCVNRMLDDIPSAFTLTFREEQGMREEVTSSEPFEH